MLKDGWEKYIDYLTELPDPLCHALSTAAFGEKLYPFLSDIYWPFTHLTPEQTRVVILTSEPHQLFEYEWPFDGFFSPARLAREGVLFWSVRASMVEGKRLSHAGLGWEEQTKKLLTTLSRDCYNIVWVLVGAEALAYRQFIDQLGRHLVISVSPLLLGLGWHLDANDYLEARGRGKIEWDQD